MRRSSEIGIGTADPGLDHLRRPPVWPPLVADWPWSRIRFTELLGIQHPLALAGMAGPTSLELVAAVSNASTD
ncbi:MAG TPA: hypothetical protein VF134_01550 [Candidatus Dormibacteraeota bacterium]